DQTLLENRARKWIDMGKPWFGGLASGRELRDFRRAGVPTPQAKSYLSASNRARWMKAASGLMLIRLFQQNTTYSVRMWRGLRFHIVCANSSDSSLAKRPVRVSGHLSLA